MSTSGERITQESGPRAATRVYAPGGHQLLCASASRTGRSPRPRRRSGSRPGRRSAPAPRWSAAASASDGNPCASLPNSHAVGTDQRAVGGQRHRDPGRPEPVAASRRNRPPRCRSMHVRPIRHRDDVEVEQAAGAGAHGLAVVGVDALTVEDTASAPAASAVRRIVPALPGSLASTRTATRRARRRTPCAGYVDPPADRDQALRGDGLRQRGGRAGADLVDVGHSPASAWSRVSVALARLGRREQLDDRFGRRSASRTACAPSARKRPASRRAGRAVSRRAAASRALRVGDADVRVRDQAAGVWPPRRRYPRPRPLARATSTSAANAAWSVTARSASTLRSTRRRPAAGPG